MLRYLRSRIGSSYEIKNDDLDDFISFTKLAIHGFPQRVSCFDLDEKLGLLAIGTKDGRIQIFGPNGVQICANVEGNSPISSIYFMPGTNALILLRPNTSKKGTQEFIRCQITGERLHFTRLNQEIHLKKITCCEVMASNENIHHSALLIGTIIGNIYALWIQNMELTEYIVLLDTPLIDIEELDTQQKSVDGICTHPDEHSKLFLLFNHSIVVYYDTLHSLVLRKFKASCQITHISIGSAAKLFCSHQNGAYSLFNPENGQEEFRKPFDQVECTKIDKIISANSNTDEEFTIFSGGVPDELDGRNTISIFCAHNSLILDFDSSILNFKVYEENGIACALFILCEEEFVAIDLMDPLWRMFPLPYLYPIHSSPITCITAISGLSSQAIALLTRISREQQNSSKIFSKNRWPLERIQKNNRNTEPRKEKRNKELQLVATGHENGAVNIWLTNDLSFRLWLSINTARDFEGYQNEEEEIKQMAQNNDDEHGPLLLNSSMPPIRKAGVFDPFADDQRLFIEKIFFDPQNGNLAIGGQAGQLMVYEGMIKEKLVAANELLLLDMAGPSTESFPNTRVRNESAIQPRSRPTTFTTGFSLINNTIAQFKPPVPITAICWHSDSGILAAGNEFGYAICSLTKREVLLLRPLISSIDVLEISNKDGPLSRFKSVKKSIRQSFRRKKKPPSNITNEQSEQPQQERFQQMQRAEREIVQRKINPNALDGEVPNSLIKVLTFKTCNLSPANNNHVGAYLFVGTQGGSVLIHAISDSEVSSADQCPLVKEIRLQHRAPIMAIECLQQTLGSRLIIFTEEQIRAFILPSLKSSNFKYRLTALEGSRIRKATIIQMNSRVRKMRMPEKFIAITTNRGEIFLLVPSNPKKQYKIQFTKPNNSMGILSSIIMANGQLFFLKPGGSEFNRCSLNGMTPTYMPKLD